MTIGITNKKSQLDGELCFKLWIETGSIYKVALRIYQEGIINQKTGKKFTHQAVWLASWNWAFDNLPVARGLVNSAWKANGELLTDQDWFTLITKRAKYIYSKSKFDAYLEKHSYLKPYVNS